MRGSQTIGHRLKEWRQAKRLSQAKVAKMLHVCTAAIGQWETGYAEPRKNRRPDIERLLGRGIASRASQSDAVESLDSSLEGVHTQQPWKDTAKDRIIKTALRLLKEQPAGVKSSDLIQKIQNELPREAENTVKTFTGTLPTLRPVEVYKPARGILRLVQFRECESPERQAQTPAVKKREEQFYKPFADWLTNDLEECTKAIPLGGNRFSNKWGTPDVIGKRESRPGDIVKFDVEIISAEIKLDTGASLITAFGQACSYKLFSHKSYIVVPKDAKESDIARLDALCMIFGIGFILFDSSDPTSPHFEIKVRAAKHEPDSFYVNECMKLVTTELWS